MFWFFSNAEFLLAGAIAVMFVIVALPRRSSTVCRRCREVNREEAVYCAQCGSRLQRG